MDSIIILFLSETFVPPALLPVWFRPAVAFSPLTYFARGARAITYDPGPWVGSLAILIVLAIAFLTIGAQLIPQTD
mgnify:CR=1 FL=1